MLFDCCAQAPRTGLKLGPYIEPAAQPSFRAADSPTIKVLLRPSGQSPILTLLLPANIELQLSVPGKARPKPVHTTALLFARVMAL